MLLKWQKVVKPGHTDEDSTYLTDRVTGRHDGNVCLTLANIYHILAKVMISEE